MEVGRMCALTSDGAEGACFGAVYYPNIYHFVKATLQKIFLDFRLNAIEFDIELNLEFKKKTASIYGANEWKRSLSEPVLKKFPDNPQFGPFFACAVSSTGWLLDTLKVSRDNSTSSSFIDSAVAYHVLPFGRPSYIGPTPPPPGEYQYYRFVCDVIWSEITSATYKIAGQVFLKNAMLNGTICFLWPYGQVELLRQPIIKCNGLNIRCTNYIREPASGNLYPFEQIRDGQVAIFSPFVGDFTRIDLPQIAGQETEILPVSYPLVTTSFDISFGANDFISCTIPSGPVSYLLKRFLCADNMYGKIIIHIYNPHAAARYIINASFVNTGKVTSKTEIIDREELQAIILDIPDDNVLPVDRLEQLRVHITKNGASIYDETKEILLAGTQTWIYEIEEYGGLWRCPIPDTIGFYINPSSHEVEQIIQLAIQRHPHRQLAGRQDTEGLELQAKAIFEGMKHDLQIGYVSTTITYGLANNQKGQRLRSFAEIIEAKAGNCIDLSVLFASILESIGIPGGVLLMPGHAMPFWYDKNSQKQPIEVTVPPRTNFNQATLIAKNTLSEFKKEQINWLDTTKCRGKGIRPVQEIVL